MPIFAPAPRTMAAGDTESNAKNARLQFCKMPRFRASKMDEVKKPNKCILCGKEFTPLSHARQRKYCDECRAVVYEKHTKKEMREQVCRYCGKTFMTDIPSKLYCSFECYNENHKASKREKRKAHRNPEHDSPVTRYCMYCGQQLPEGSNFQRLYCSRKCQRADYERRKAEGLPSAVPAKSHNGSPGAIFNRTCHDCGEPCNDYRCPACWLKRRRGLGLLETVTQTESEWDNF